MKKATALAISLFLVSCGGERSESETQELDETVSFTRGAGASACEGGPAAPAVRVQPRLLTLGGAPDAITHDEDDLYIVESFSNTTSRFDAATGRYDGGFADSTNDRNPYDAAVEGGELWVTNYLSNTVSVFDAGSGELLEEVADASFANPSGVALTARRAYVTNVDFGADGVGAGSVTVIDRATRKVLGELPVEAPNPHFAQVLEVGGEERVVVVSSGTFDPASGATAPGSNASVLILTERDDALAPERVHYPLPRNGMAGLPGRALPSPDGRHLYFASASAPVLFKLDALDGRWVRDADDPIRVYETSDPALHRAAIDADGILWLTAFNTDRLYAVDTRCDATLGEPIELGLAPGRLEGPLPVVIREVEGGRELYFATSLSEVLGRVLIDDETP